MVHALFSDYRLPKIPFLRPLFSVIRSLFLSHEMFLALNRFYTSFDFEVQENTKAVHHPSYRPLAGRSPLISAVLLASTVSLGPQASCLIRFFNHFSLERMTPKNILQLHFD